MKPQHNRDNIIPTNKSLDTLKSSLLDKMECSECKNLLIKKKDVSTCNNCLYLQYSSKMCIACNGRIVIKSLKNVPIIYQSGNGFSNALYNQYNQKLCNCFPKYHLSKGVDMRSIKELSENNTIEEIFLNQKIQKTSNYLKAYSPPIFPNSYFESIDDSSDSS